MRKGLLEHNLSNSPQQMKVFYFFNVMQPTEVRFWASEILAYTSVVATFL